MTHTNKQIAAFLGLSVLTSVACVAQLSAQPDRVEAFGKYKMGLFVHYTFGSYPGTAAKPEGGLPKDVNELADNFDTKAFANVVDAMGAQYVQFTVFHAGMNVLYPSRIMGDKFPHKASKRDLIGDLLKELDSRGIKLVLYWHPQDGHDLTPEEQHVCGWGKFETWNPFITSLIDETSSRYGDKIAGYWLDSLVRSDILNGDKFKATILENSPHAVVWVNYGKQYNEQATYPGLSDLIASEYYPRPNGSPNTDDWPVHHSQMNIVVGGQWWAVPNGRVAVDGKNMYRFTIRVAATRGQRNGGVVWAASPYVNQQWEAGVIDAFNDLGKLIKPRKESIYDTLPSTAYVTLSKSLQKDTWGVATDSADGKFVYLHVLDPPKGRTLTITKASDDREFTKASLLIGGQAMKLKSALAAGYELTLPEDANWEEVDTVIRLRVDPVSDAKRKLKLNLALDRPVKVSSNHITTSPTYLTDGKRRGEEFWSTGDEQATKSHVEWVVVDMGQSQSISRVNLYPRNTNNNHGDGIPSDLNIKVSDDETTWKIVTEMKNIPHPNGNMVSITFPVCKARYVKVEGTRLRPSSEYNSYLMQLSEVEVYSAAKQLP
ncbi:MAG: discoidin domain-containing protein [Sedimentisphaerales bacterium]